MEGGFGAFSFSLSLSCTRFRGEGFQLRRR